MAYFFRLDRPKESITAGSCVHAVVAADNETDAADIDPTRGQRETQWVAAADVTITQLGPASDNFRSGQVVKAVYARAGTASS